MIEIIRNTDALDKDIYKIFAEIIIREEGEEVTNEETNNQLCKMFN